MAEPNVDEINVATRKQIMPSLADNFFKSGPVMRYAKEDRMKIFPGGTLIQENFIYKPMKGGAYSKGSQFDITRRQTKAGMQFDMKFYEVNVTEFTEDIEVTLRTPEAVFNTVRVDLANAALTLSAILEIAIMRHGQNLAAEDRSIHINGFEEALNDGVNTSYKGNLFPSYGGQTRADVAPALTPPTGLIPANVPGGTITNRVLEHTYQSCVIGDQHPALGITTTRCMGFINENYLPLQRLADTMEPVIGWPGVKFKQATIVESNYAPGQDGVNDPDIGDYSATAETFLWLNPGPPGDDTHFRLHISASPKYQFGFTGFKVGRDDTQVAGQILVALNFIVRAPRLMRFLFGITA
jgi:hypothetical protein